MFSEIAEDFLNFIEDSVLVIHNAAFDMKFINYELTKIGKTSIDYLKIIDTLSMARKMFPGSKANLDSLCKRFKVDNSDRAFHGALKDARLLSDVYVELCGGRQSAFSMQANKIETVISSTETTYSNNERTKIVTPTDQELEAHRILMTKIS